MKTVFHEGELAIQRESGVQERMHKIGNAIIRDHVVEQHKEFFEELPYLFVALEDAEGHPWMSFIEGQRGFIRSPDEHSLDIQGQVIGSDFLDLQTNETKPIGLLGLDLSNRRRNRLNGNFKAANADKLSIHVGHSFGNCPKYIQTRRYKAGTGAANPEFEALNTLSGSDVKLIQQTDTLFIASSQQLGGDLDASHRGGNPGFVNVTDSTTLWFNDYPGNNAFQTFGNVHLQPIVGLLFIDFESGDLLLLSGNAQLEKIDSSIEKKGFIPRRFNFKLEKGIRVKNGINAHWEFDEASPFLEGLDERKA